MNSKHLNHIKVNHKIYFLMNKLHLFFGTTFGKKMEVVLACSVGSYCGDFNDNQHIFRIKMFVAPQARKFWDQTTWFNLF
jgi:hypothetical protein